MLWVKEDEHLQELSPGVPLQTAASFRAVLRGRTDPRLTTCPAASPVCFWAFCLRTPICSLPSRSASPAGKLSRTTANEWRTAGTSEWLSLWAAHGPPQLQSYSIFIFYKTQTFAIVQVHVHRLVLTTCTECYHVLKRVERDAMESGAVTELRVHRNLVTWENSQIKT